MSNVSRRKALGMMAAAPAASLVFTSPQLERVARVMAEVEEHPGAVYDPKFFTVREWEVVRVLVDDIIPRDERSGSATEANVPEWMDAFLTDPDTSIPFRVSMRGGLLWLDAEARDRFGRGYAACTEQERHAILDDIAWPARARPEMSQGVAFFNRFRDFTSSGFWASSMGWRDLQYIGHTFVPVWTGCPPAALEKLGVSYPPE